MATCEIELRKWLLKWFGPVSGINIFDSEGSPSPRFIESFPFGKCFLFSSQSNWGMFVQALPGRLK